MREREGSAVGFVVVATGTSSYVGRLLCDRGFEGRRNKVQFFLPQKLNRKIAYVVVAPGMSSYVGRMSGNRGVEGRRN